MKILIFGVSNVGKTVTGSILAKKLDYSFFDLDEEVKRTLSTTLEDFVNTGTLQERDHIRCEIIDSIIEQELDFVLAVSPLSYPVGLDQLLSDNNVLAFQLTDHYLNIFERLVFSDENDVVYTDDEYKNEHKIHYLMEILKDQEWYGAVYSDIPIFSMNGRSTAEVVDAIISKYALQRKERDS